MQKALGSLLAALNDTLSVAMISRRKKWGRGNKWLWDQSFGLCRGRLAVLFSSYFQWEIPSLLLMVEEGNLAELFVVK